MSNTRRASATILLYVNTFRPEIFNSIIRSFNRNLFNIKDEMSGQNMFP